MMPRMPWRKESNHYEQINNDNDHRQYPHIQVQSPIEASSDSNNKNCGSTLALGPSEPVSPFRAEEPASSLSMAELPLIPPIQVQVKPRPRLRKSGSVNRRLQSRSAQHTVRRRCRKDLVLQKNAILQSIKQREPSQNDVDSKHRRCKSLEESQRDLGCHVNGHDDNVSETDSMDSTKLKTGLHDGNHRQHRNMTRLSRSVSASRGRDKARRRQRSFDSRSSSGDKRASRRRGQRSLGSRSSSGGKRDLRRRLRDRQRSLEDFRSSSGDKRDLNRTIHSQRSRQQQRSASDLQHIQRALDSRSSSAEKRHLKKNIRSQRLTHYQRHSESDLQPLQTRSISVEGTGCRIIRPNYRVQRSRSFEREISSKHPRLQRRSESPRRREAKLTKLEDIKKQREPYGSLDNGISRFKIKPPALRKQKDEISAICNQAHQRHQQRYSLKKVESAMKMTKY